MEVVGAVRDDVIVLENLKRVGAGEHGVVLHDVQGRVERVELVGGGVDLEASHVGGRVNDLALEIAGVHRVEVDQAESANARCGEIQRKGRTEAAGTDAQHTGGFEFALAFNADLGKDEVAGVALEIVGGELGECGGCIENGCRHTISFL